jgi:hypothetical protein
MSRVTQSGPHTDTRKLAVVLIVSLITVLGLAFGLIRPSSIPGSSAISNAFVMGVPSARICQSEGTFQATGCAESHYAYFIPISYSRVGFGDIGFSIVSPSGSAYESPGALGFTVLGPNGTILAQAPASDGLLSMSSTDWTWTFESQTSISTPLTASDLLVADVGPSNPSGLHLAIVGLGQGSQSGTTSPLLLP